MTTFAEFYQCSPVLVLGKVKQTHSIDTRFCQYFPSFRLGDKMKRVMGGICLTCVNVGKVHLSFLFTSTASLTSILPVIFFLPAFERILVLLAFCSFLNCIMRCTPVTHH